MENITLQTHMFSFYKSCETIVYYEVLKSRHLVNKNHPKNSMAVFTFTFSYPVELLATSPTGLYNDHDICSTFTSVTNSVI